MPKDIINYPDSILRSFNSAELEKIVENSFTSKTKDYKLLAAIIPLLGDQQLCPFFHAVSILEDKAIEVMIENFHCGHITNLYKSNILSHLWSTSGFDYTNKHSYASSTSKTNIDMTIDEKKNKIAKIAKILFKYTDEITQSDLENYAKVASVAEFNKLIIERKIDLSKMDLKLPLYEMLTKEPLLKGMNYNSVEDILLMHTYSENKTQGEVRQIYSNLLNINKVASDIMHFTALNLLKGHNLKIVFDLKAAGLYAPMENIIGIGEIEGKFTDESIAVHELGHYAVSKLYPYSNMMPFDLSKLHLLETTQDDIYGYYLNGNATGKVSFFEEAHDDLARFLKYEQAAKKVFVKAGGLLGLNEKEFEPYILSKDVILYLKDNSPIDLFMLRLAEKMGVETDSLSKKMVIYDSYISYVENGSNNTCPVPSFNWATRYEADDTCSFSVESYVNNDLSYPEVTGLVVSQYIPFIVEKFSLNEDRIFFLERISELMSRGKDIYGCPASYTTANFEGVKCNVDAFYQELIVRQTEFAAINLDKEVLSSFDDLVSYWEEDITPLVEQLRVEFLAGQKFIDFSYHTEV